VNTNIPAKLDRILRSTLLTTSALAETARWVESKSDVLVIEGDTGSGKSVAAAWAWLFVKCRTNRSGPMTYGEMHAPASWPVWVDAPTVASLQPWSDQWAEFDRARLVVVDDVGTEEKAERMQAVLERLWNVSSGRAVITTNLTVADFGDRYGARVASRLAGSGTWARCSDPDMRIATPAGEPFRRPEDETHGELVARMRSEEERRREAAEWEAGAAGREVMFAEMSAKLSGLIGEKRLRVAPSNSSDAERRELLRKQVEQLKTDREGA
jgi:hypothetical protein